MMPFTVFHSRGGRIEWRLYTITVLLASGGTYVDGLKSCGFT
jgi:hypothetical protein